MSSRWTPERDEQLRKLAAAKLSGGRIARALGPDFTRNMVVSRAKTLGVTLQGGKSHPGARKLRTRAKPVITLPDGSQKPQPKLWNGNVARWAKARGGPRKPVAKTIEAAATEPPAPGSITILALTFPISQCRWIDGEPAGTATICCGAPVEEGSSYCPEHADRCYQRRGMTAEAEGAAA